jgi:hypothetical protein
MTRACVVVLCCVLAACQAPVDCAAPPASASLLGSWSYRATQNAPTPANLLGTLVIETQCGTTVTGSLDVTEIDAQGSRRRTGTLSGNTVDSVTVDFDVFLSTVGRRHVGNLAADSIGGTWIEPLDLGSASGSFVALRLP